MAFKLIFRIEHSGNAALCVGTGAFIERVLGDDQDIERIVDIEGESNGRCLSAETSSGISTFAQAWAV
jgi:hypothetical protein